MNVVHKGGGDANRAAAGGLGQHAGAPGQGGTSYPHLSVCYTMASTTIIIYTCQNLQGDRQMLQEVYYLPWVKHGKQ